MKRRLACIVLAALLLLGLCCTAFAEAPAATEAQLWNITDTVGLLTSDEDLTLEARAEEISAQYGVGIYLLILEDYSEYYDDPYETAYELYHQNTLGMGEDRDGVILLMSMSDRKYATFFYGPKAEYAFDAYGQELMEEEFLDDFRDDDWYDGFSDYLEVCAEYLERAEAGDPVRGDDSSAGGSDGSGIGTTILVCLGISAVIAMIVCLILRGKMKSVRKGTHADAYVTCSLNLTASRARRSNTNRLTAAEAAALPARAAAAPAAAAASEFKKVKKRRAANGRPPLRFFAAPCRGQCTKHGRAAYHDGQGGMLMAGSGTIVIQIYTSDARLPLQDASIAVTRHGAAGTELVAFRVSNYDGMTEPIRVETPDFSESQQSGAAEQPFASVDIEAEAVGYGRIFIRNAQIFADRQTVQPLRLIPTPSLPESYTRTQIVDVTPQDL